jgi:glycosyltransferase involved in cell wall biosynthesis
MISSDKLILHVIAYTASGASLKAGLSGGDRIFIECAKRWIQQSCRVYIYVWEGGYLMCKRNRLQGNFYILPLLNYKRLGDIVFEFIRTIKACIEAIRVKLPNDGKTIVYSASNFWPDSIPAWILKTRFKKAKWIAGFYLFPPHPLSKESPYRGKRTLRGLLYYLLILPVYILVRKQADMVWVTNELDRWKIIDDKRLTLDRVIAVRGGVDTKTPTSMPDPKIRDFDAVFIGRFHPQKGVLELMDIWKMVCEERPGAKLAMIGMGDLEDEVRRKVKEYGLKENVFFFGFKDGVEKLEIFKRSKVVVHPATYESGGMAPCEAMACGLPGVSFDLPALRTYYPKGMLKVPCYNLRAFAKSILRLLDDKDLYKKTAEDALNWAREWDWDNRAYELLRAIEKLVWGK